ncbi:hypothetical protein D3C85_1551080 [compost metagenome]
MGRAAAVQRGQHVEFALMQVVLAKRAIDVAGGKCIQAEHARDDRHGGEVLRGAFLGPLRDDVIDEVIHGAEFTLT